MPEHFEELRCWQLADSLRTEVNAICSIPEVAGDFKFCDSLRATAGSVCRNLSEGFARFHSASIVQFFEYALGSIAELQDHLVECRTRKFIDQYEYDRLKDRAEHVKATTLNFMRPHVERVAQSRTRRKRPKSPNRRR